MKKIGVLVALSVGLAFVAYAKGKPSSVMVAASELKWVDQAGTPGVQVAVVEGDATKGAHHAFHKFPGGFSAPLHHHSSDHYGSVVSGSVTITPEGMPGKTLGAGSFFEFHGGMKHTTTCEAGADCVLLIDCRGKWDVVMAEAKKGAK